MVWGEGGAIPATQPLGALGAAIEAFCEDFRPASDPADVAAQLVQLRSVMDRLEVVFSQATATFAATDEYQNQGATSPIEWVRHNCKMTSTAAAEKVCVGEQMERMPQFVESLFAGRVGFGHLAHTARTARKLMNSATGAGFDETELLERAEGMSVGKFGYACRHYLHARDPQGVVADELAAAEMREASVTTGADGRVHLSADLDPEGGAIVRTALEALARPTGAGDNRHHAQRMGDAVVEGLLHVMEVGALPTRGGQRVHLQVSASFDTVKANLGAPAADLEFSLPVSGQKVRRWSCDCSLTRILLNSDSIPIDVGREKRIVPGATRKAVNQVCPGCGYPGCDRTASWTQAHHIQHWINGGPSDVRNIVPLCFRHHVLVHEGGWTIVKNEAGLVFVPPARDRVRYEHQNPDNFVAAVPTRVLARVNSQTLGALRE